MADLAFFPWARTPLGSAVSPAPDGRAVIQPSLTLRGPGRREVAGPAGGMAMLGPEAVAGLDPRTVTRMDPPPGSVDHEPNYLACVEFAQVELPWLFTPERVTGDRLRPWLVLVVSEADRSALVPGLPLPVLDVGTAELPDLGDAWGWAHVQAPGGAPPATGIARLLCPRRLSPDTRYRACVVPAYRGGVDAGLGAAPGAERYALAWDVREDRDVRLPVYHSWEFATGPEGDFESLVRRLVPVSADEYTRLGHRMVDVSRPWAHEAPLDGAPADGGPATLPVRGALCGTGSPPAGTAGDRTLRDFAARAAGELNAPADRLAGTLDPDDTTGAVAPPIYGGPAALRTRLPSGAPDWVEELNLRPEHRIAAAVGAAWVRANQEFLMARAWEQVGAVREANRRRRGAELSATVAGALHRRHVERLTGGELLAVAAPAAARTRSAPGLTLRAEITVSTLADAVAGHAFARFVRPAGPVARAARAAGAPPPRLDSVARRGLEGEVLPPDPAPLAGRVERAAEPPPDRTDALAAGARAALRAGDAGLAARRLATLSAVPAAARASGLPGAAAAVERALAAVPLPEAALSAFDIAALRRDLLPRLDMAADAADTVTGMLPAGPRPGARDVTALGVQVDAAGLRRRLSDALHPGQGVARRLADRVRVPGALDPGGLEPVMACPEFPVPAGLALRADAPEWFLPGIGDLPLDRAALVRTNEEFAASFMVGLNHEMNRELRWREYPTDLRGTPFTRFWPRPGGGPDIAPVHTWTDGGGLRGRLAEGGGDLSVLIVRGDVVRRYPGMIVAAVPANAGAPEPWPPSLSPGAWRAPRFVIGVDDLTAAYAFDIPAEEFRDPPPARPLWYLLFAEHGQRLRFGFDVSSDSFSTWDDLAWANVEDGRGFAIAGAWPRPTPEPVPGPGDPPPGADGRRWNSDAAEIARIAAQAPFRVFVHPHRLLGRDS